MKQTLQRYFTMLMAVVVLIANTGIGIVEHSCSIHGKVVHLASLKKESCHHCHKYTTVGERAKDATSLHRKLCCEYQQRYENVQTTASFTQFDAKFSKSYHGSWLALFQSFYCELATVSIRYISTLFISTVSSIFHGRSILAWIQVWLI